MQACCKARWFTEFLASRFAIRMPQKRIVYMPVIGDYMQAAPYDFLEADDELSQDQVDTARAQMGMWTSEGCYPLLPYSSVVLEAVPEQQTQNGRARAASQTRQVQNHSAVHRQSPNSGFAALALKGLSYHVLPSTAAAQDLAAVLQTL